MVRTIVEKEIANYEWIDIAEPTSEDFAFIKERFNLNEASIKD
ncbi:MAG TPA: magnesium transporter CorA, partial [Sphingobacterium sp.]|nr:magnesium transporter CorA [Sphingobacterium sp.]